VVYTSSTFERPQVFRQFAQAHGYRGVRAVGVGSNTCSDVSIFHVKERAHSLRAGFPKTTTGRQRQTPRSARIIRAVPSCDLDAHRHISKSTAVSARHAWIATPPRVNSSNGSSIAQSRNHAHHLDFNSDPGGNPGSISHRCHPILVAFVLELT